MKITIKAIFLLFMMFNLSYAFAWSIDHFTVEFWKKSTWLWEALDLTITAVDRDDNIVTDYTWNVIGFSETDDSIELPEELSNDDWYSFKASDQWVKKFENWVVFKTSWDQSISFYDTNDFENVTWKWIINIVEWVKSEKNVEIEILTPESNTTLPETKTNVSWATQKNHQIKITINDKQDFSTTSNSDWIFEKEITWLSTGKNVIKAYTLDADENIIWESEEVIISIDDNKPKFKKIILSPLSESWSVEENTNVDIKVFANKSLKSVKILFDDWVISLSETEEWIYTWSFKTPSKKSTFPIDVVLSDNLWHTITEKDAVKINVFLVENNSALETNTGSVEEVKEDTTKPNLKIEWLKVVKLKNKSVLTWDKLDDAKSYDVYKKNEEWKFDFLKNVPNPKFEIDIVWDEIKYQYFAIKAKTETASWELITWDLSEATKIQTWPKEILLLIIALILWFWFMFLRNRKNA